MRSDVMRAGLALAGALALSTGAVQAAPWLKAQGYWPAPPERLYTIINLTEDVSAYTACPLDEWAMRSQIEDRLSARGSLGIYSPIAEGDEVLTIEAVAIWHSETQACRWTLYPDL